MLKSVYTALVSFGIADKVTVLSDTTTNYLVITIKENNNINWPDEVTLGYEKLIRTDSVPKDMEPFVEKPAIIYKIVYQLEPEKLEQYVIDIDIGLEQQILRYISKSVPNQMVYPTFVGLLISAAFEKAVPLFSPLWQVYQNDSEGSQNE